MDAGSESTEESDGIPSVYRDGAGVGGHGGRADDQGRDSLSPDEGAGAGALAAGSDGQDATPTRLQGDPGGLGAGGDQPDRVHVRRSGPELGDRVGGISARVGRIRTRQDRYPR